MKHHYGSITKQGHQYPADKCAKISRDCPRNLVTQGVASGMAICDPAQGVQAQGPWAVKRLVLPLTQKAFQGDLSPPARWRRCLSLHLVGREKASTCCSTPELTPAVKPPGVDKTDDRTAVSQASSSETDEPDASQMWSEEQEEESNTSSPSEMATETGSTPACSSETGSSGETAGRKRKTEVGPTPSKTKKDQANPLLGTTFMQAKEKDLLGVVLVRGLAVQHTKCHMTKSIVRSIVNSC